MDLEVRKTNIARGLHLNELTHQLTDCDIVTSRRLTSFNQSAISGVISSICDEAALTRLTISSRYSLEIGADSSIANFLKISSYTKSAFM